MRWLLEALAHCLAIYRGFLAVGGVERAAAPGSASILGGTWTY